MHIVNECGKVTIGGLGNQEQHRCAGGQAEDLRKTGKKRGGPIDMDNG
jgi:hypothetical protein